LPQAHNTVSHANIAQSIELSQHVCAGQSKVSILDSTFFFYFWTPHFSVSTPHFGWTRVYA